MDPKNKSVLETLESPRKVSLVLIDAENYSEYPISQFEEDNVLRELNKCLLAFRQKSKTSILDSRDRRIASKDNSVQRRFGYVTTKILLHFLFIFKLRIFLDYHRLEKVVQIRQRMCRQQL